MIDARFIEAKRRAAKNTGDGPGNTRRRRHGQRGERTTGEPVSPSTAKPTDTPLPHEKIDLQKGKGPRLGNHVSPKMSPQVQHCKPTDSVTIIQKDGQEGQAITSVAKPSIPMQSLENATSKLSIREDMPPPPPPPQPKQGRQRPRNRGRSNMSKPSSPQRTFQTRTSSDEPRSAANRLSTGSRNDLGTSKGTVNIPRKGVLPINVQRSPSQTHETPVAVIRLPDLARPPVSNDSHDTNSLIRSEDTDFGSDISRGAVHEGKLYSYRLVEKSQGPKNREYQKPDPRSQDDKPEQPQRGLLHIQPTKTDQGKQQQPGHRGGLLFIDTNVLKSTNNTNNTKPTKPRINTSSEFNRNIVPLRKEPESQQRRAVRNPDNISSRVSPNAQSGPQLVMTQEDILREVKVAYQGIENLERKVNMSYDSQNERLEMTRMQRRPTSDSVSWTAYSKTHKELLEFYHTFFILTQHPSASSNVRRLPKRHDVLARYWKYGIVQLLEFFRQKLPSSEAHMHDFIFGAYALTGLLLQDVPVFQGVWMECLGDLARYLYAIEENDAEDKDHWREIAREWYLKTIDVNNGIEGRLYHHLGILSKDDRFLQLYYFAKSLTVVHGFSSARESFLILIDPVLGKRESTSWTDVFLRLHGMLFARLQLDSFDDEMDSFFNYWGEPFPTHLQWAHLASTTIAALYQYNRKDSRLKEALRQGRREKREAEQEEPAPSIEETADGDAILPPSQVTDTQETDMANVDRAPEKFTNIPVDIRTDDYEDLSLSKIVFEKSCLLAFNLLSEALNSGISEMGAVIFVHVWLVFLAYSLRYQPIVRLLERKIPWQELVEFLNDIHDEIQNDSSMDELSGPVLMEDVMMRGFEWSRKLFPKGWFENIDPIVEDIEDPNETCDTRKQRVLSLGIQISKICDCIEFSDSSFQVSEAVKSRIAAAEAKEAEEVERMEEAAQAAREAAMNESFVEESQPNGESDEDADIPGENEEIRALKARRRELKALLTAQRPDAKKPSVAKQSKKDKIPKREIKSGYTILVFDTNLLVSHLDLLKQVIETGEWQVVVPLIVVNELDGLKVNPPPLGAAAAEAVTFVEQALSARKLRVITQEGTPLMNLNLRSQQLVSKTTEDGARTIDAFIIRTVKDQIDRHSGKLPNFDKAILVTGDRSMRVIAKARGVQALSAADLRKEIFKKGDKGQRDQNKKAWG